ncbi:hypothetical protein LHK_02381 [Laribacter hongkongensis HLHK9]|uniref:Uncharacterized protein n=1 Tax=Laribacter hongkongensis (strain HLHK9) TaxID=557598 RepID=C1DB24_LARHH|nr:hypothetical protein LHK_02381 [Laribacter hongkongensis HLHK9]
MCRPLEWHPARPRQPGAFWAGAPAPAGCDGGGHFPLMPSRLFPAREEAASPVADAAWPSGYQPGADLVQAPGYSACA